MPPTPKPAPASGFYSLTDVARELGTYRSRVLDVARRVGAEPTRAAGSYLFTASQLAAIRADHRARPPQRKGPRPRSGPGTAQ